MSAEWFEKKNCAFFTEKCQIYLCMSWNQHKNPFILHNCDRIERNTFLEMEEFHVIFLRTLFCKIFAQNFIASMFFSNAFSSTTTKKYKKIIMAMKLFAKFFSAKLYFPIIFLAIILSIFVVAKYWGVTMLFRRSSLPGQLPHSSWGDKLAWEMSNGLVNYKNFTQKKKRKIKPQTTFP